MLKKSFTPLIIGGAILAVSVFFTYLQMLSPVSGVVFEFIGIISPLLIGYGTFMTTQFIFNKKEKIVYQLSDFQKECLFTVIERSTKHGDAGIMVEMEVVKGPLKGNFIVQLNLQNAYNGDRYIVFGGQPLKLQS